MQSLANQLAVKLRDELKLSPAQHMAVELVIYRLSDFGAVHSYEDIERWIRNLVKALKA